MEQYLDELMKLAEQMGAARGNIDDAQERLNVTYLSTALYQLVSAVCGDKIEEVSQRISEVLAGGKAEIPVA